MIKIYLRFLSRRSIIRTLRGTKNFEL